MPDPSEQIKTAMEQMAQAGQAFTQAYMDFLARQQSAAAASGVPLPKILPNQIPDGGPMADLHKDFAALHGKLWHHMMHTKPGEAVEPMVKPEAGDRRFNAPEWAESPVYDYMRQAYLLNSDYLRKMAEVLPVEDGQAKARVRFLTRQVIEALSPTNFAATNPEFIKTALETKGESITRGLQNLIEDMDKGRISMTDESVFEVGRNLATTEGAVIFENDLMQLIQYAPLTEKVAERPVLIVPPCINKYYIMDLAPENSLVRFIVEQGHTVFLISWKNPMEEQAKTTWDDYLDKGPIAALSIVREVSKGKKPNVLGFCVGGTLLTSALAVLRGRGEDPVESLTLMTTLLDFSDPGELGCFIDEGAIAAREAAIGKGGLLPGRDLASVFSMLRANDLIWQYVVGNYLKGKKPQAFDLLYWNSDSTNLPGPFLVWYLRNMYLTNSLRVPGKLEMLGVKVDVSKVKAPAYLLATREDHIVPWKTAYLARKVLGGPTTFVLGASGHIAGAINPASKNKRSFWVSESEANTPDEWLETSAEQKGSWWLHWAQWLAPYGGKQIAARKKLGNDKYQPLEPAPGRYVKERA
jgi:polyhydroxyalkanoate synthase